VAQDFFHQQYQKNLAQTKRQFHFIRWIVVVAMQNCGYPILHFTIGPSFCQSIQWEVKVDFFYRYVAKPQVVIFLSQRSFLVNLTNLNHQLVEPVFVAFFLLNLCLGKLVRSSNEQFSFPYLKQKHLTLSTCLVEPPV